MVKRDNAIRRIRILNKALLAMFFTPLALLSLTIIASTEKTPITGRHRLILLSPEEEETIHSQLTGNGWYAQVYDVLTSQSPDGKTPPTIIPTSDWRWKWVEETLRRLEIGIYRIYQSNELDQDAILLPVTEDDDVPIPPPLHHPLNPRPRAFTVVHGIPTDDPNRSHSVENPHTQLGPPYSFVIVENPERNAFSYGFGAEGAGGIVLYSGFLDEVLQQSRSGHLIPSPQGNPPFLLRLFGLSTPPSPTISRPSGEPTPEQTASLATLLSHELAHLLLSHHLETLSSGTIFVPTITSIVLDFARVILFPITFLFGPFVGDALTDFGKVGMGEVRKQSEACSSHMLELEADEVSIRLMRYAGFDPRKAVDFWERKLDDFRALDADSSVGTSNVSSQYSTESFWSPHHSALGSGPTSHPVGSERVRKLKAELQRWRNEAEKSKLRSESLNVEEKI
ncbi:uncharacterized protein EI90DRAFT_2083358 [Cantharellus anzutake]|uniref:uncharacterized protein n=1 Tax=Cantharellus anzutake TaxID=1750568 RepID=UPI001903077F|nr:uncharacterized protein EI90DRAFT_2083358 [Cantharellus anzutake]KAF8340565.1 hypothetical protein EI90DRAFT_2083358 [Cantharellus anzutake]